MLMLDIALDGWFRVCVERMEKSKLSGDDLIELVTLVLDNASIAVRHTHLSTHNLQIIHTDTNACISGMITQSHRHTAPGYTV